MISNKFLKFHQSEYLQKPKSQSEARNFCATPMRELPLVGAQHEYDIQKRGLSRNLKVSTVNIEYLIGEFPVLVQRYNFVTS